MAGDRFEENDYEHEHEDEMEKNSIFHTLNGEGSCEVTDRERNKSI
jgi:hypothetical protein